jgi:hypothetical protein
MHWPRNRRLYLKDFSILSKEADALAEETEEIKGARNEDITTDRASLALLSEADEWDTSIRICLVTWKDLMDSDASGEKNWSEKSEAVGKETRKRVIGEMRARCKEGLAIRKQLGPQLQKLHQELIAR